MKCRGPCDAGAAFPLRGGAIRQHDDAASRRQGGTTGRQGGAFRHQGGRSRRQYGAFGRQSGAALVVSLVLMLALTVLGVSAMNMSMLELAMATGIESQQGAFEAAETGIEIALAQPAFATVAPAHVPATPVGEGPFETQTSTVCVTTTAVPDVGFSIGAGSGAIQAFHFEVVSVGTGPRGAVSTHRQGFYVIGPAGSGGC